MKTSLLKFFAFLNQFGMDPLQFLRALRSFPAYLRDLRRFSSHHQGPLRLKPCLHDRYDEGGVTKSEYFWQDLLVARWIYEANPLKHVDVGSRVDGFVAHVASFREIEVLDVRPITASIPGVRFRRVDLMSPLSIGGLTAEGGYCDSLSCLHVLEHLGLGRYGDQVDTKGYKHGFAHLAALLQPHGILYLSTPIGRERVEFNANWVFDPYTIMTLAASHGLQLRRLMTFNQNSGLSEILLDQPETQLDRLAQSEYLLGIMQFVKEP